MIDNSPITTRPRITWLYLVGLGLLVLAAKFALIDQFGNSTPFWDQWDGEAKGMLAPAQENRLSWSQMFAAHCEHRIFLTRVLLIGLVDLNGIWDPKVEMVTQAFIHVGGIMVLIALCGRFLTSYAARLLFGFFVAAIFALPFGWENTLWGFQSQFYLVVLWGLIGIGCCWRNPTLSRGWWVGVIVFCLGPISMAGGVFAPAVTCGLIAMRLFQNRSEWVRQGIGLLVLGAVTAAGLLMIHHVSAHSVLKAQNIGHFFSALLKVTSWPSKVPVVAFIAQAPLVALLVWALWKRISTKDPAWLLITLGMWCSGQAVAIAYGRAVGSLASRYADNFSLSLCVGFACLLYLFIANKDRFRKAAVFLAAAWVVTIGGCLIFSAVFRLPKQITKKAEESLIQERHVKAFVLNNDIAEFTDKPFMHVPYPNSERLADTINHPSIRAILPTNVRAPLSPLKTTNTVGNAFRPDGFGPTFTNRDSETSWGSFDASGGATGSVELQFPAEARTAWLKISVTGYSNNKDFALTLIDQKGTEHKITLTASAVSRWRSVFFHRPAGPFTLRMTDNSPNSWLAFTLPREVGALSLVAGFLQDQAGIIAFLGVALIGIALWKDPETEAFARHHRLF
ncbi:hypothetical protein [Rariglobus hedericola]|uniref:Uncharacterized protein n=1 Tax=Rariglobus hedericola TaxID=2597822 RepID=A0A556QJ56_9BACT|nr:hypothetical protein [Rariglobus hedericola]TSJ76659.1 hypothetical protein FPL22_11060 [Rariglobus hedericola]